MTTASFRYMQPGTWTDSSEAFVKPWSKVDGPGHSFSLAPYDRDVTNIRGQESNFHTDTAGFSVHHHLASEKSFTDDAAIRNGYYAEVEGVLREKLPGIAKVVIFDHTIRRRDKASPRQPVQQVHVDQTPGAAEARVRRHLSKDEADTLLRRRWQLINVWRPIENPASDFPLAVIDWRSTKPEDFVKVDLLYPRRDSHHDDDDRGKEVLPNADSAQSTQGYEVKGETFGIAPNEGHRFHYVKDMSTEETMFIKCFDSWGQGLPNGKQGIARCTPHTAFVDPNTPSSAPGRQSIEVRCLVFYD